MGDAGELRGILSRKKGFFGGWSKYTYVKKENYLMEFKLGANHVSSEPLAMIELNDALIEDAAGITGKPNSFAVHSSSGKSYFLLANNNSEKDKWIKALSSQYVAPSPKPAVGPSSASTQSGGSAPQGSQAGSKAGAPSAHSQGHFDGDSHSQITLPDNITLGELENAMPVLKFLESFTDAVIVGNINGLIVSVNSAAEKLFGISKHDAVGDMLTILMPEPYKSQHDGYLFRHEKFGSEKLIGKTRKLKGVRDGKEFDIQISLGKLPAKGYFIATIREV